MSYLLYTSLEASNGLIPQPGRVVNTFPSGLVRVDQTYLGLTANAATHRAILAVGNDMPDGDTAPCIDGLKIFPEAQERRREDGWTEYIVSAYGRMNLIGRTTTVSKINPYSLSFSKTFYVLNSVNGTFGQRFDFKAEVSSPISIVRERTNNASLAISETPINPSLLKIKLEAISIVGSDPTAENWHLPDNYGRTANYFLGFNDFELETSVTISTKSAALYFYAKATGATYSNGNPTGIYSNGTMTPPGTKILIGQLSYPLIFQLSEQIRNFGDFNETIESFEFSQILFSGSGS